MIDKHKLFREGRKMWISIICLLFSLKSLLFHSTYHFNSDTFLLRQHTTTRVFRHFCLSSHHLCNKSRSRVIEWATYLCRPNGGRRQCCRRWRWHAEGENHVTIATLIWTSQAVPTHQCGKTIGTTIAATVLCRIGAGGGGLSCPRSEVILIVVP